MKKIIFLLTMLCLVVSNSYSSPDATTKIRKDYHPRPSTWVPKDHIKALKLAQKKYEFVKDVFKEDIILRQMRFRHLGIGIKDIKSTYMVLQSPFVNTYEDIYGPVRFMHGAHAKTLNENCVICHHYSPKDSPNKILPCRACHQDAFNPEHAGRIGLKAAYHQRCIGCHKQRQKGPIGCTGCHLKNVPDHKKLVKLPKDPTPTQVTQECLRCHKNAGQEMLTSAHWLWRGPSPYTVNHLKCTKHGKGTDVLNND